jgi:3-deoxy-manno-octulosonate cytidylyltransferase (CMP-KDO synthetase)
VAVAALLADPDAPMATLSLPLLDLREMLSPSVVKVVVDARGDALYFSRCPIPFVRSREGDASAAARAAVLLGLARKHVGLYVYRREALLRFASYPPAPLERAEGLEQLRALHHGMRIRVAPSPGNESALAVDTPEDLARVRTFLAVSPS